jgi:hypothetical protein
VIRFQLLLTHRTQTSASLLMSLETILDPKLYPSQAVIQEFVSSLGRLGWVEQLVISLEKLIEASVSLRNLMANDRLQRGNILISSLSSGS